MKPKLVLEYTQNLRALFVDDDEDIRRNSGELFGGFFAHIDTAVDGLDALEKYKAFYDEHGEYYDIVITDINMPKRNGIGLSSDILEINEEQTIIVISAHNEFSYLYDLMNLGVTNFLPKPLNMEKVLKVLYKTGQAIHDHKMLLAYYDQIEQLNKTLEERNRELEKHVRILDTKNVKEMVHHSKLIKEEVEKEEPEKDLDGELLHIMMDDLPKLNDIVGDLDVILFSMLYEKHTNEMFEVAEQLYRYASIVSGYLQFDLLSKRLMDLVYVIREEDMPKDWQTQESILKLIEGLVFTFQKWNESVVAKKVSPHFLDDSMISDIDMVISFWDSDEASSDDNLLLFF
jgi:YesN/AraC family two-component response regulator